MFYPDIVPFENKNQAIELWSNPDKMMIMWCPIIPIKQNGIYFGGTDAKLVEKMYDLRSPKYVVDSAMCYVELKLTVENPPAETCINKFHKTCDVFCF